MSAERHIPDENNRAFTSRLFSLPVSTQRLKPKLCLLNNTEIQAYTSNVFLLHQQTNFFPHNSSAVSNYGECLWGKKGGEVKPLCASLLLEHMEDWIPENSDSKNMASPSLWVRHTECALDELPVSVCHRYRVSPAQPHTGSESHLFTSRLQTADSSSPRVTGRGGGQISFWNFNLLQLNYLISEPPTSKEYLSSLLPGCLDGGFHSLLLKDSHFISLPCGLSDALLKSYSAPWNQRYIVLINLSA